MSLPGGSAWMIYAGEPGSEQRFERLGFGRCQHIQQVALVAHVVGERHVDQFASGSSEGDDPAALVIVGAAASDESGLLQAVDPLCHRSGGNHGVGGELAGCPFVGFAGASQRAQDIELPLAESIAAVDEAEFLGELGRQTVQSADHSLRGDVNVRSFATPVGLDALYVVLR